MQFLFKFFLLFLFGVQSSYAINNHITPIIDYLLGDSLLGDKAKFLIFSNKETDTSLLSGTLSITKASNENDITDYVLYWGSDAESKLSEIAIANIPKTSENLLYTFPDNTPIPSGATHLLVFSKNINGEMQRGVNTAINHPLSATSKLKIKINAKALKNHVFQAHNQYGSQITYKNNIYVISFKKDEFISEEHDGGRPYVNKISERNSSLMQTELLDKDEIEIYRAFNDGHHRFSLSIDKEGYIHIIGDMHHGAGGSGKGGSGRINTDNPLPNRFHDAYGEQMYWISNEPEDISEFTFIGNDINKHFPCNRTTYNYFIKDMNATLYLAGRQSVRENKSHELGTLGLCLAKYNAIDKLWQIMGNIPANNYGLEENGDIFFPSIVWEPHGYNAFGGDISNQWYQSYYSNIKFDSNNRMHLTTSLNADNNHSNITHIMYAYSDNGGSTFKRLDTSNPLIHSLPMRITDTDLNKPTIILSQTSNIHSAEAVFPAIFWNNTFSPVITYTDASTQKSRYKYFEEEIKEWISKDFSISVESIRGDHYNLKNNTMITIGYNKINHKSSFVDSGTIYKLTTEDRNAFTDDYLIREVDNRLLSDKNILRGISEINNTSVIISIEIPMVTDP